MDKVKDAKERLAKDPGLEAIALYAVAARDPMDFLDMIAEAEDAVLLMLYKMMALLSGDSENDQLNSLMAPLVARALESRGVSLDDA